MGHRNPQIPGLGEGLLVIVPRAGTDFSSPYARASLPTSPPHQAVFSPAWGPDLTPWNQGRQQSRPLAQTQTLSEATWCRFPLSQPGGEGQGGPSQNSFWKKRSRGRPVSLCLARGSPRPRIQEEMEPCQEIPTQTKATQQKDADREASGERQEAGH